MKKCKCGSTEFQIVEKHTETIYSTCDNEYEGVPNEVVYRDDDEYEFICYTCERCRTDYGTWDEIPEA